MYSGIVFPVRRILPAAVVVILMLTAFFSGVASADAQESQVMAEPFPSITLNMTGGVFYNLSYMGLILQTPNGSHIASFNHGKWNFTDSSNGSYSYSSEVRFLPDNSPGPMASSVDAAAIGYSHGNGHNTSHGNGHNSTNGNPPQNSTKGSHGRGTDNGHSHNNITAEVVINLKSMNDTLSNMSVMNSSASAGNYSFPRYSMLEITISVTFSNAVEGPGNLELVQLIKSSNVTSSADRYYFGDIAHGRSNGHSESNSGVQIPAGNGTSGNSTMNAFYWWNNSFDMNGVSRNLSSNVTIADGGVYITFNFPFNNSTSMKSVYQDPYIGIPGYPIFKNPIVKKIVGTIINYVVVNIESLSAGLAFGVVLVGGAVYSIHRRRRF